MAEAGPRLAAVQVNTHGPTATLRINAAVYCREAVLRALHWYTDRLVVSIASAGADSISVSVRPRKPDGNLDRILADFENSLVDAQLRVEIGRETATVRELIVAKAFAEGDLLDDSPVGDWSDPVAILDERNGKD